jgi:4-amino-4-deoxy-L-arabinose transferase-like glycosyltransferase
MFSFKNKIEDLGNEATTWRSVVGACVAILLIISFLIRWVARGLFLDGLVYASVARNMAVGKGHFSAPYFDTPFVGHPPLMMYLESWFFRLLGDFYYTEKIYSLVVFIATVWVLYFFWVYLCRHPKGYFWIPLLFWGVCPSVLWAYPNNMIEPTLSLFALGSVYYLYVACARGHVGYVLVGCVFLLGGFLCKGVVAVFPLAVPFIYWIVQPSKEGARRIALYYILILFFIFLWGYFVATWFPHFGRFLETYWQEQVVGSLAGRHERVDSELGRLYILYALVQNVAPMLVLAGVFYGVGRRFSRGILWSGEQRAAAIRWLLIGLSASLPIVVSIKQRSFYVVPSLPYFALGLGMWVYPYVQLWGTQYVPSVWVQRLKMIGWVLVVLAIGGLVRMVGTYGRDEILQRDIRQIATYVDASSSFVACPEMHNDWVVRAYLQRMLRWEASLPSNEVRYAVVHKQQCTPNFEAWLQSNGFRRLAVGNTVILDVWVR